MWIIFWYIANWPRCYDGISLNGLVSLGVCQSQWKSLCSSGRVKLGEEGFKAWSITPLAFGGSFEKKEIGELWRGGDELCSIQEQSPIPYFLLVHPCSSGLYRGSFSCHLYWFFGITEKYCGIELYLKLWYLLWLLIFPLNSYYFAGWLTSNILVSVSSSWIWC